MSGSLPDATSQHTIAHLCRRFLTEDPDAWGWAFLYPDEDEWESPDCDVMSARFLDLARSAGVDGHIVRADSLDEGSHWFAVVTDPHSGQQFAVDWTARQFHNAGHPLPPTDPELITCPLVFEWPAVYPLDVVHFDTVRQVVDRPISRGANE